MKLKIKDEKKIEEDVCEVWLDKSGDNLILMSSRNGIITSEFSIYPNGSWIKLNNGNLNSEEEI